MAKVNTCDREARRREVMHKVAEDKRAMFRDATGGRINLSHDEAHRTVVENVRKAERQKGEE